MSNRLNDITHIVCNPFPEQTIVPQSSSEHYYGIKRDRVGDKYVLGLVGSEQVCRPIGKWIRVNWQNLVWSHMYLLTQFG